MNLNTPVEELSGIGKTYAKKLQSLGIAKVEDFIFYFPRRYEDYSNITSIVNAKPGETVTLRGGVWQIANRKARNRRMTITEAIISDGTGTMKITWFNQPFLKTSIKVGDEIVVAGRVELNFNQIQMASPSWEKFSDDLKHSGRIVPVYPETEGVTSKWLRYQIKPILKLVYNIKDYLPENVKEKYELADLPNALRAIHFPNNRLDLAEAKKRLGFDELFPILLSGVKQKIGMTKEKANPINFNETVAKEFVDSLPFTLTNAQKKVSWEIIKDLKKDYPANRLIQGDVGSGKTIVAAFAMYLVVKDNCQAIMMVPTEILARQHFASLCKIFEPFGIGVGLVTGKEALLKCQMSNVKCQNDNSKIKREELLKLIKNGEVDILVGTHSLISPDIQFKNLALAIVDEQHRFGVDQRQALRKESGIARVGPLQGVFPHFLSMTATPIPRSLQLTIFGDLDVSVIDELPPGRQQVTTKIVESKDRQLAYEFIEKQLSSSRQCFVICPLIEESEAESMRNVKSAKEEYEKLKKIFSDFSVGLVHGKVKTKEKDKIMQDFKEKKYDILVATPVVEVGIDIPNASIIIIETAERFGLASLHQLRGRVGRSGIKSYCLLFSDSFYASQNRLKYMAEIHNGIKLAEIDLKFRGPGDAFGTHQHGILKLKVADIFNTKLLAESKDYAENYYKNLDKHPKLKNKLQQSTKISVSPN